MANLRLKPREHILDPPGISVILGGTPQQAAQQIRTAFPKATRFHALATTVGSSTVGAIGAVGFDVMPDPSRNLPNHGRLLHPQGAAGFSDDNLAELAKAFQNTQGC